MTISMDVWQLTAAEAAKAAGLTESQLKNYQTRFGLFPDKKRGTGRVASYDIRDIIKLAAMEQMIQDGFQREKASQTLSPYSLWGVLLHNPRDQFCQYPGTFIRQGHWTAGVEQYPPSHYELRLWPIFDRIWPRFEKVVRQSPGYVDISNQERRMLLKEFRERMDNLRAEREGKS